MVTTRGTGLPSAWRTAATASCCVPPARRSVPPYTSAIPVVTASMGSPASRRRSYGRERAEALEPREHAPGHGLLLLGRVRHVARRGPGRVAERAEHAERGRGAAGDALAEDEQVREGGEEPADGAAGLDEALRVGHGRAVPRVPSGRAVDVEAGDGRDFGQARVDEERDQPGERERRARDRGRRGAARRGVGGGVAARDGAVEHELGIEDRREQGPLRGRARARDPGDGREEGVSEHRGEERALEPDRGRLREEDHGISIFFLPR